MRIFVTGTTGFAGTHLVAGLLAQGHDVYGLVRRKTGVVPHARFHPVEGDLLDLDSLVTAVRSAQPDVVYHLAGQAYPARSWQNPAFTLAVNTGGTANLLEAVVAFGRPRVVVVTSAEIYGKIRPDRLPITERTVARPRHPYGVSKLAAGQLVSVYWQRYELPVVEARPFNHIGPGQALGFVVPDFASQIAAITLGLRPATMQVGNLAAERDFTDVRDVVRAYSDLAERGEPGESYLICSGQPVAIHTILNILCAMAGREVEVVYDPARMRPSDVPVLYGSHARIAAEAGWRPKIHLRQTLRDVLDEWIDHYRRQPTPPAGAP